MGKVHGSLARAGKVRAATPKVEKQPKKRQPVGRAKKRLVYQKRMINNAAGKGPKKSPNAQSSK